MNWFGGSIHDAVATSKRKKAYFIVYVEGTDEQSVLMTKVLDNPVISKRFDSNNFVAIKLVKGSEGHKQFEEFYKLVPVPSIFFIDQNGSPAEIVVSDALEENVLKKLNDAIDKCVPSSKSNESLPGPSSSKPEELLSSTSTVAKNESVKSVTKDETASSVTKLETASSVTKVETPSSVTKDEIASSLTKDETPSAVTKDNIDTKTSAQVEPMPASSSAEEEGGRTSPEGSSADRSTQPRKPSPARSSQSGRNTSPAREASDPTKPPIEDRVERAKLLLDKKKEEKKEEEMKNAKSAELERRIAGQKLQQAKRDQHDRELQQLKEERERAKKEEALARQRILDQIKQDRAERAQRLSMTSSQPTTGEQVPETRRGLVSDRPSASVNSNTARLQFKLPNGVTQSHTFPAETTLLQVREFIDNNIELPFSEYQMATTFPRREFTARENTRDLRSLQLLPSAVILILPVYGSVTMRSTMGWTQMIIDMMWDMVRPVISLSRYIGDIIFRRRGNIGGNDAPAATGGGISGSINQLSSTPATEPSAANRSPRSTERVQRSFSPSRNQRPGARNNIRKRGNVYSLRDSQDDNDENNTWNGNSTQQM